MAACAHCSACNETTALCSSCEQGYFLQNRTCVQCSAGCEQCQSLAACEWCDVSSGYYSVDGLYCTKSCGPPGLYIWNATLAGCSSA